MYILLIGSGAREHAIARALARSPQNPKIFCLGSSVNPGIKKICADYAVGKITDSALVLEYARKNNIDFVFVGPEAPLAAGVPDELWKNNIPCVGPKQKLAQLESSKSFTRELTTEYNIPGRPFYQKFSNLDRVKECLEKLGENGYVIKADGLMGGKGVKVAGDHLHNFDEALAYCEEIIAAGSTFLIEEKLIGQEFSLMSFCDGDHLAHMPPVQDHKRAFDGDLGPNTGGMGSYSDANHLLPFLTKANVEAAQKINEATAQALRQKFGEGYKGILYGGFMVTKDGVRLIEYNARLGDPEAMNVLAILESDLVSLCQAIIGGDLTQDHARFAHKATVCKYAVPDGYPDNPVKNEKIDISGVANQEQLYLASVDERADGLYEIGSRTAAVIGIADTISEAEQIAEVQINQIKGPLFHRKDIGTKELIGKRVEMMKKIYGK